MKNIYSIILGGILCLFGAVSCVNEEADIFNLSPAERLNKVVSDYTNLFVSAENGWVMEYFPTDETEGYIYLMKFGAGGEVTIAGNNKWLGNKYREETSLFNVLTDNGPVLSLSSYNKIFHLFAFPADPNGQDKDLQGLGLQGDYEFVIMKSTDNMLEMRGKKRDTHIYMYKLPADVSWTDYMDKVKEMDTTLFGIEVPLFLKMGSKTYEAYNGQKHIFSFLLPGEDLIAEGRKYPFVVTTGGIRLYTPFKENEISVQSFTLSEGKDRLIADGEKDKAFILATDPINFFNDSIIWTTNSWTFDKDQLGGAFVTAYANVVKGCKDKYKEDFDSFNFKYVGARKGRTLNFKSGKYDGNFDIKVNIVDAASAKIAIEYLDRADKNGLLYSQNVPGFSDFLKLLFEKTYTVSCEAPICPKVLKFTDDSNPDNWFTVFLK